MKNEIEIDGEVYVKKTSIPKAPPFTKYVIDKKNSLAGSLVGKYVIVRSRNEGVNAGKVLAADDTGIILEDARRLWEHWPKDSKMSWYEGVALSGLSEKSKISETVPDDKIIIEKYSATPTTFDAEKSIREFPAHDTN